MALYQQIVAFYVQLVALVSNGVKPFLQLAALLIAAGVVLEMIGFSVPYVEPSQTWMLTAALAAWVGR